MSNKSELADKIYPCSVKDCKASFGKKLELDHHLQRVHVYIECDYEGCNIFYNPSKRRYHVQTTHADVQCDLCKRWLRKKALVHHLATVHADDEFQCRKKGCKQIFKTLRLRNVHEESTHGPKVKCPISNCTAKLTKQSLNSHIKRKHDKVKLNYPTKCNECGKYISKNSFNEHVLTKCGTAEKNVRCTHTDCSGVFISESAMKRHIYKVHTPEVECPIDGCSVKLKRASLKFHIQLIHEKKEIMRTCQHCNGEFSHNQIVRHRQMCKHGFERAYKCDVEECDKGFKTKQERDRHQEYVHGEPIVCPEYGCGEVIKIGSLLAHMENCHYITIKKCEKCGKKMSKRKMFNHREVCAKEPSNKGKTFSCPIEGCNSVFSRKSFMWSHKNRVHSELIDCPFPDCGDKLKKASLSVHVRYRHDSSNNFYVECEICGRTIVKYLLEEHQKRKVCVEAKQKKEKALCSVKRGSTITRNISKLVDNTNVTSTLSSSDDKRMRCFYCRKMVRQSNWASHQKECKVSKRKSSSNTTNSKSEEDTKNSNEPEVQILKKDLKIILKRCDDDSNELES